MFDGQDLVRRFVTNLVFCFISLGAFASLISSYASQVYFESDEVHACIVTCGGLCPGLNTVIREIVCGLSHMYGVKKVLGIDVRSMIL